jgi:hypothetical protein
MCMGNQGGAAANSVPPTSAGAAPTVPGASPTSIPGAPTASLTQTNPFYQSIVGMLTGQQQPRPYSTGFPAQQGGM